MLGDYRLQNHGELYGDLPLLVRREHVDNPVDGVGTADGVQRGENQVSGFGSGHRYLYGFIISHFSKQNHIRALAQGSPQSRNIAVGIGADLPLADNALFMLVQIFQRVFQRDNMFLEISVDIVNHTGQRRGLSASGGAGYQYQSFLKPG